MKNLFLISLFLFSLEARAQKIYLPTVPTPAKGNNYIGTYIQVASFNGDTTVTIHYDKVLEESSESSGFIDITVTEYANLVNNRKDTGKVNKTLRKINLSLKKN